MIKLPSSHQFAGACFKRLSCIVCSSLMILAFAMPLPAADILYVTLGNNTIVSYDTTGNVGSTIAASVATFISSNLSNPQGLAFDSTGNLWVGNVGNSLISKFNASGGNVISYNINGFTAKGLAFDSTDNLYVAFLSNNIGKFGFSGETMISQSYISSNLNGPVGLAFDSTGNLYAANAGDSTISKFNASGGYISNITSNLSAPQGLAFDSTGNLYAANARDNTISKFSSSGGYISNITSNLSAPYGLAFDSSGNLYAANNDNRTISKYDSSGNFLTSWSTGSYVPAFLAFKPVTVPEPSTYALAAIATGVMAYLARRRKARTA